MIVEVINKDFKNNNIEDYIFIFFTSFLILSPAVNVTFFKFFITFNLSKFGLLFSIIYYFYIIKNNFNSSIKDLKIYFILLFTIFIYSILNSLLSLEPVISFKISFRILCFIILTLQISFILTIDRKYHQLLFYSIFIALLVITLIWVIDKYNIFDLSPIKKYIDNYLYSSNRFGGSSGLYINPGELGFALTMHLTLILWSPLKTNYSNILKYISLIFIGIGISQSEGRSPFLGFVVLLFMWYCLEFYRNVKLKNEKLIILFFLVPIFIILIIPERFSSTFTSLLNLEYHKFLSGNITFLSFISDIKEISIRLSIWQLAYEIWQNNIFFGIGAGSFSTIQNF